MQPTTTEDGAANAQPTTNVAEQDEGAMVISTDENGTPAMVPVSEEATTTEVSSEQDETKPQETSTEVVEEEAASTDAQAKETDSEIVEWAKKKGIEINPENPNEVKLARLQLENDRRFHEAQQAKPKITPPELIAEAEDPVLNTVIQKQNEADTRIYVRDWFDANPEMKEYRDQLMEIASRRPYLNDLDDVAAHLYRDPKFISKIREEGGRHALENLAQKQSAVSPQSSASNTGVYSDSNVITPKNVYDLVDKNDQEWFEKNHDAISRAMQGK